MANVTAEELREATREANAAMKDLRALKKEVKEAADAEIARIAEVERRALESVATRAATLIDDAAVAALSGFNEMIDKTKAEVEDALNRRFNRITNLLLLGVDSEEDPDVVTAKKGSDALVELVKGALRDGRVQVHRA